MKSFLYLLALSWLAATPATSANPTQTRAQPAALAGKPIVAGQWKMWIEYTLADDPMMHAPRYHVVVYREGPHEAPPKALFRATTNQPPGLWLREDGVAIIDRGQAPRPLLAIPGHEPREIVLPQPSKWEYPFEPQDSMDSMWFLGDVVVYSRSPFPEYTLVGFFRIDTAKNQIVDNHISVAAGEDQDLAFAALIDSNGPLFRAGDFVFWINLGNPSPSAEPWRQRKVRALNLKSNTVTVATAVPAENLRPHKDALVDYLERKVHNGEPDLEAWALSIIGQIGSKEDLPRLASLESTANSSSRSLYAKVIASISFR